MVEKKIKYNKKKMINVIINGVIKRRDIKRKRNKNDIKE